MNIIANLTRMWLTRSVRPFTFTDEYDRNLPFRDCDNLGLYVHIPFCRKICSFCPYCKTVFDEKTCSRYIDYILKEIHLICSGYSEKKKATSLYFGGGTPALASDRIGEIITALMQHFDITEGIGIELHPDDVTEKTLRTLKDAGITKISIGIQSFSDKFRDILGRNNIDISSVSSALSAVPFETVSMDMIFALPTQTFDDLKSDIDTALSTGANHIAIYPFIDFTFTDSKVKAMAKKEKRRILDSITEYCFKRGLSRDSIWTFSSKSSARYSSMTRESFLGFGCSATSLFNDSFKINTFDIDSYFHRIDEEKPPTSLTLRFTKRQRMVYWLFWTAYTTKVRSADFEKFFDVPLEKMFGTELRLGKRFGLIKQSGNIYEMTPKGAFYYHYFESFYTLAYIDKMWGIMRKDAFPDFIKL